MNLPTLPKGVATCNPLNFENTSFEVIDRDGFTWLRGLQVASALGYKNPAQDFKNLYARSADEFTDEMTALVELPTKGGIQSRRVGTLLCPRGQRRLFPRGHKECAHPTGLGFSMFYLSSSKRSHTMQLQLNLPNPLAARESLFLDHDQPYTTSRAVAERFGKNHKDVLRAIEKLLADSPDPEFSRRNFAPRDYIDGRGKTYPEYRLTHDGFALLAMRFTGAEALAWQIAFIQAFNALEAEVLAATRREAQALYRLRPNWRAIRVGTEGGLTRKQICTLTGHRSPDTITANKRRMREAGLFN